MIENENDPGPGPGSYKEQTRCYDIFYVLCKISTKLLANVTIVHSN